MTTSRADRAHETGWHNSPYSWLLAVLILLLVSQPVLAAGFWGLVISNLLFSSLQGRRLRENTTEDPWATAP